MKRAAALTACALVLSGCAVPLPVKIASWVIDGISYIATKKSLSDHAISVALQQDCAVWRGVTGEGFCLDDDGGVIAVAANEGEGQETVTAETSAVEVQELANFATAAGPAETAEAPADAALAPEAVVAEEPAAPSAPMVMAISAAPTVERVRGTELRPGIYFVIGSFNRADNAERLAERYARLRPMVMVSNRSEGKVYRVVVGPTDDTGQHVLRERVIRAGASDTWAVRLNGDKWTVTWAYRPGTLRTAEPQLIAAGYGR
jgi:hypothetical protein